MEENLPQPQVSVSPDPVPSVQPTPKRFPLKWLIIIALLAGIVLTGTFLIFKSQSAKQTPAQAPAQTSQLSPSPTPTSEGAFCGGIAGKTCPEGYECQLEGSYPDAGGKCVKVLQ